MGYTMSWRQASASKGGVHRAHNRRDQKAVANQQHIDPNGHYETWIDKDIREFYHETFDSAVAEFNARQKNKDRIKTDYYNEIYKSTEKEVAYEFIIQIGDVNNRPDDQTCRDIMREYIDTWQDINPNLKLIGAYYHADEATPHLHVDYVPVYEAKRGMSLQNGLNSALQQQGVTWSKEYKNISHAWQEQERDRLQVICEARGLTIDRNVMQERRDHMDQDTYKAVQANKQAQHDLQVAKDQITDLEADISVKQRKIDRMDKTLILRRDKDKIEVDKDVWQQYKKDLDTIDAKLEQIQSKEAQQADVKNKQAQEWQVINEESRKLRQDRDNLDTIIHQQIKDKTRDYDQQLADKDKVIRQQLHEINNYKSNIAQINEDLDTALDWIALQVDQDNLDHNKAVDLFCAIGRDGNDLVDRLQELNRPIIRNRKKDIDVEL